ncbi:DUF2897 family protein [Ferrimonas sp. SCSIO 43195]|uniref:DUF2897 family protein n=1 Tax=Ferrimonas kyonanensis TaxID=364763 RepID=UPI000A0282B4|nr:DUF2897 family protein [Ferrimonas kyonanensis]USD36417.1 DUF2897 family protein [Ferrimonas sp. SCSIO 43195]
MENWQAWLLIALILGIIVSNIMVIKHTANFKMPQFGKPNLPKPDSKPDSESGDDKQG